MIKTLYLYFYNSKPILFLRWLLDKSELKAVTFDAYLAKLKKDKFREWAYINNNWKYLSSTTFTVITPKVVKGKRLKVNTKEFKDYLKNLNNSLKKDTNLK